MKSLELSKRSTSISYEKLLIEKQKDKIKYLESLMKLLMISDARLHKLNDMDEKRAE